MRSSQFLLPLLPILLAACEPSPETPKDSSDGEQATAQRPVVRYYVLSES